MPCKKCLSSSRLRKTAILLPSWVHIGQALGPKRAPGGRMTHAKHTGQWPQPRKHAGRRGCLMPQTRHRSPPCIAAFCSRYNCTLSMLRRHIGHRRRLRRPMHSIQNAAWPQLRMAFGGASKQITQRSSSSELSSDFPFASRFSSFE